MSKWEVKNFRGRPGWPCVFLNGKFHDNLKDAKKKAAERAHRERICRLRKQGVRVADLAERFELTPQTIHYHIRVERGLIRSRQQDVESKAMSLAVEAWRKTVDVSAVPKRSMHEFVFSVRTANCLDGAGIKTLRDLMRLRVQDLRMVKNMGSVCRKELLKLVTDLGLALPDPEIDPTPFLKKAGKICDTEPTLKILERLTSSKNDETQEQT